MFVAYILTKSKFLKFKIIKLKDSGIFTKDNFEYKIDRERIYQKKFLGFFKLYFWSMYLEGNPNPIKFTDKGYDTGAVDMTLDEIAIILKKLRDKGKEIVYIILLLLNLLLSLSIWVKVWGYA